MKREPRVRRYNWASLFLGDIQIRDLVIQVGRSLKWSRILRQWDPRVINLARPRSSCMSTLQTYSLIREGNPTARNPQLSDGIMCMYIYIYEYIYKYIYIYIYIYMNSVVGPSWVSDTKTDRPTSGRNSTSASGSEGVSYSREPWSEWIA
jgi:hypothetical protein